MAERMRAHAKVTSEDPLVSYQHATQVVLEARAPLQGWICCRSMTGIRVNDSPRFARILRVRVPSIRVIVLIFVRRTSCTDRALESPAIYWTSVNRNT